VGIGASAGGLEALERLFAAMPRNTGMAFVVVQHLSPDFKSLMNELLARRTDIPIQHVEDGIEVKPDNIYLIPPKKSMIMSGGRLLLSDKDSTVELSLPIDVFFRSLAQDLGSRAISVVLSGSGSDGSRGIREIHEAGGLVICQDDESAKFDGMPKSARDTGVVDFVVAPEAIPQLLLEHAQHPFGRKLAESLTLSMSPPRGMGAIYRLLQNEFGLDFSHYKPNTVTRRIEQAAAQPGPRSRRIRPLRRGKPRRARCALPRSLDRGHALFPRRRRVPKARRGRNTGLVRARCERGGAPDLGRGLRNRRGSIFDRDPTA